MQIELSIEELGYIERSLELMPEEWDGFDSDGLYRKIIEAYQEAEELDSLDLNDCGDACKL